MFWIALAAQLSAPVPENVAAWFVADDVPDYLMRAGSGVWGVPIRVTITPQGTLRSCGIEATSGVAELDKYTCKLMSGRARFKPARSTEGLQTHGVYRTTVIWIVADAPWDTSKLSRPDVEVTVQRLPQGLKSPALVRVMFAVAADGQKSSCAADEAKGLERVQNHPALVPIACEQVLNGYRATRATDAAGQPVASVQNALVRFSVPRSK